MLVHRFVNSHELEFCSVKVYVPAVVVETAVVTSSVVVVAVVPPSEVPCINNKCIIVSISINNNTNHNIGITHCKSIHT